MLSITSDQQLTIESQPIVEINKNMRIRGFVCIDIPYKIVCDLTNIPPEEHSVVIQTLMHI